MRYFEDQGTIRRAVSVVKRRSGPHAQTIREMTLGPTGLVIGEPLRSFAGCSPASPRTKETGPVVNREASPGPWPDAGVAEPVLILTPTGRDAALAVVFARGGHSDARLPRVEEFCAALDGAAAGLIAEEALPSQALDRLIPALQRQPVWSDVP